MLNSRAKVQKKAHSITFFALKLGYIKKKHYICT